MNHSKRYKVLVSGFTLIELLITVVILGVLAGLAIPSFLSSIAKQELKTHTYSLENDLKDLRNEARAVGRMPDKTVSLFKTDNIEMDVLSSITSAPVDIAFNRFGIPGQRIMAGGNPIHVPISSPITYKFSAENRTDRSYQLELATTGKVKVTQIN